MGLVMNSQNKKPIIFTDLDGTLLDHDDYSFSAALPALAKIKELAIPLIINSSKTRSEIIELQEQLGIHQPFISENGAAVYIPDTKSGVDGRTQKGNYNCHAFARPVAEVLDVLQDLRKSQQFQFTGFSDCDCQALSELTGLSLPQSILAAERDFTEPLLWQDTPERLEAFKEQLSQKDLIAQQGGRFLSITNKVDKAKSMRWLCQRLGGEHLIVALGDSHNDEEMLNAADIAVVIKSRHSENIHIPKAKKVIKTSLPGPAGWQAAMNEVLPLIL